MSGALASYRWLIALVAGLFLLGLVSLTFYDPDPGEDTGPALRTGSNRPSGARALLIWLDGLGYETRSTAFRQFAIAPDTRVLFVLRPTEDFATGDIAHIERWVEHGGVLVMASDVPNDLMAAWDVRVLRQTLGPQTSAPVQPVFRDPPVRQVEFSGNAVLTLTHPDWTPLLKTPGAVQRPLVAVRQAGDGIVYAIADPFLFSNHAIGEPDNAALILHLLAGIPPGSSIAFDEYHHGLTEHGTLSARLLREPWGWAIIYSALLVLLYLAFSGRRFGKAAPHAPIAALRSRAEYVATMGSLLRRGGHTAWLRGQYAVQVKRALGARFGVRADQPARDFAAAVSARGGDTSAIGPLLERLEMPHGVSEQESIELMRDIDRIQKRLTG